MKKVSIVIVTYNNLQKYTKQCFRSVINSLPNLQDYEIIFVDNASKDGTKEWLEDIKREYSCIKVILNDQNLGYARANNQGILYSNAEYVILLNNDTLVKKGWIEKLVAKFYSKEVGLVGPVTNSINSLQEVLIPGLDESNWYSVSEKFTKSKEESDLVELRRLCFFCVVIPRYVINDIGLLDENFGRGNFEDDDFCLRVSRKYKICMAENVFVWHYGSGSFSLLSQEELSSLYTQNKAYISKKYGRRFLRIEMLDEVQNFLNQQGHTSQQVNNLNVLYRLNYINYVFNMVKLEANYLVSTLDVKDSSIKGCLKKFDNKFLNGYLARLYRFCKK